MGLPSSSAVDRGEVDKMRMHGALSYVPQTPYAPQERSQRVPRGGGDDDDMPRLDERSISGVGTLCHDAGLEAPVTASALTLQLAQLEQM